MMNGLHVGSITITYRGQEQLFPTVERAVNYLRDDTVKTTWLHKVSADVFVVSGEEVRQTHHLKGKKYQRIGKSKRILSPSPSKRNLENALWASSVTCRQPQPAAAARSKTWRGWRGNARSGQAAQDALG
jgi:hypothetical protein